MRSLARSLFSLCMVASALAAQDDPTRLIRSKDPLERLQAIEGLRALEGKKAFDLLVKALDDEDWEVAERAAIALGEREPATKALVDLALEGPVRRLRATAAAALASSDADEAVGALAKKLRGRTLQAACEALAIVAPAASVAPELGPLAKLVKDKDARLKAAAARALVAGAPPGSAVLAELLASESIVVRAAALEQAEAQPRFEQHALIAELFEARELVGVLERRAARALAASLAAGAPEEAAKLAAQRVRASCALPELQRAARGPRLASAFARAEWADRAALAAALEPALTHAEAALRAGALRALVDLGGESAPARAREFLARDASPRVRRAALATMLALAGELDAELAGFLVEQLGREADAALREELCVALGQPELEAGVSALQAALTDRDWGVAVCAAVSLGRTRSERALEPLVALAREHADWRLRGAGVVGLTQLYRKEALPALIEALADAEPLVARTSHGWLTSLARRELPLEPAPWRKWWGEEAGRTRLEDPRDLDERRRRFGYEVPAQEIFRGLDVLVLASRGDKIEVVLDFLGIPYRATAAARIDTDGLDAGGVFVANCTGEVEPKDLERIAWFVRAGGYLFGSCWALTETIGRVAPGAMRKLETRAEVLDAVLASPCAPGSPYLEGVFAPGVQPIYALQGAHLIELVEPERVEVLIDSPECAERWGGGGELAAWFRCGHGVILDSVNHFDVQGLELATGLKKPEERMAYAVDHMGLTYAKLRATRGEKWWSQSPRAAREVKDLSVFELVTNFVRLRRIGGR